MDGGRSGTAAARLAPLARIAGLASISIVAAACGGEPGSDREPAGPAVADARYVGAQTCTACHARQAAAWRGSDHARAMEPADSAHVLGDFREARFVKDGVESTFTTRDGRHYVTTDGPGGVLREYAVAYTFGVDPLQQYLLEMPGGRLQALGIAWDARTAAAGGQRWFSLHPDERIPHDDVLHWTAPANNWNHMCADCHSTNVEKGWRADGERFETTFSDVSVACEACHGPGSAHVAWAAEAGGAAGADGEGRSAGSMGLTIALERDADAWAFPAGETIARRTRPLESRIEVETCGRCHSRRAQLGGEAVAGAPLARSFRVALLDEGLYHADGQIQDEVYEYGSFLASRMHAEGVTCSDCHEPHSARLRIEGNLACAQCHLHAKYDRPQHHFHPGDGAGTRCVDCHMPMRTYMGIDLRRDHGFRVPRPDLSRTLGTPNACNDCHSDRTAEWAGAAIEIGRSRPIS